MAVFDPDSFQFDPHWEGDEVRITHFEVESDLRGEHYGSAVLETLKRVYYYEGAEKLVVRMGGGEAAESFLQANDFEITNRKETSADGCAPSDDVPGLIVTGAYTY